MGLKVRPRITDTSQSNRSTQGHHIPYPMSRDSIVRFDFTTISADAVRRGLRPPEDCCYQPKNHTTHDQPRPTSLEILLAGVEVSPGE
jgi:hypothetical protein